MLELSRSYRNSPTSRLLNQSISKAFSTVAAVNKHEHLLAPLTLTGDVQLKNRVLMGSMHTGLEESGNYLFPGKLDTMAAFYAERAKGQVGIIVTGGISPNIVGTGYIGAAKMSTKAESNTHKVVTQAVHENGGKIAMQILHTGRYGYQPWAVSASAIKAPINWVTPSALSSKQVWQNIDDFVNCATLAQSAGYDGVEIMGSEGYFINQFLVKRTNQRTDEWGGSYANRKKLPIEIVKRVRRATGPKFIIIYRLSMLDLVEDGSSWEEIVELAKDITAAGASIINTGIGWHEARIPTIATMVPRGAFTWVTRKLREELHKDNITTPLCTTNRINSPQVADEILKSGSTDMISMARPFLADPMFVQKAMNNQAHLINTCIGCNQACLDHIFEGKKASCLVNPVAAHETNLVINPVPTHLVQDIAVVGAGPAGLSCAVTTAQRGHRVTLFEKDNKIGGQFNLAKQVPGKEEFYETLRYFYHQLQEAKVTVKLGKAVSAEELASFSRVVLATGVTPREINLPNKSTIDPATGKPKVRVISYVELLKVASHPEKVKELVGERVAVVGAGGIGFDVADFLTHDPSQGQHGAGDHDPPNVPLKQDVDAQAVSSFLKEWGIDTSIQKGGLVTEQVPVKPPRKVYLLQRKTGRLGSTLGKTTGWVHRSTLKRREVTELAGCKYLEVNDEGLLIEQSIKSKGSAGAGAGEVTKKTWAVPVDTVVICAGQEPLRDLQTPLVSMKKKVFLIGGSLEAGELDAKRAIDQGTRLAAQIESAESGQVFNAPKDESHKVVKFLQQFVGKKK